jgi:hypothetical protein
MTENPSSEVVRRIVIANHDQDLRAIAVVLVNKNGELELEIGFDAQDKYTILAGLFMLANTVSSEIITNGQSPGKVRE